MNRVKAGSAAVAVLSVAGLLAGCGKDASSEDSPVAFSPVTGDQYTSNPGAFQTDGVVVPPKDVTMVGDPIPAQAAVNAGLPQGTITSTSNNTTVYYPPAPAVPGLVVAPQPTPPAPMSRPANTRPWQYTQPQIDAYRAICETGRWGSWIAGVEAQSQTCWTLYGRQLGVRPWTPDQPRPWLRPGYPRPWFDPGFRADVPVIWIYPRNWTRPRPQPIISVSITINILSNPYRRVPPRFTDPFYPVWAVTPGRVVDARDQGRIVAPVYTVTSTTTSTTTTTVTAPVAPGVVLQPLPTSAKVTPVVALPGQAVPGNVNTDPAVTVPVAAALQGATVQAGSRSSVEDAIGTSVSVAVASPTTTTATTPAATGGATAGTPGGTTAATSPGAAAPSGSPTSAAVQPSTAPAPGASTGGAPTSAAPTVAPGETPPAGSPAPATTAAPAPQTPAPAVTVAPAPTTTLAPPPQTTVAPAPQTTVAPPPVTTQPPATTQAPVVTQPPTTQAPVITPPKITTTVAPVPTTTVAPKPVAPKPVAPKPVVPEPTVAKPVPTTTTPPPAN
ncbi:hypothetical protein [Tsukamurella hominis]|uniref:hypothetical protein n=1 Tax=Tsukamurella hominis TaxID=1970232 RepID=UPI0039ECF90D